MDNSAESKPVGNIFKRFCCGIKFFFTSPKVGKWSGRVLLAFFLLVIYGLFFPHTKDVSTPVDLQHAGGCPIPLPASAKNIQYYSKVHWVQYIDLVRFEAPVNDCLDYVEVVLESNRDKFGEGFCEPDLTADINELRVSLPTEYRFSWFDIENVSRGQVHNGNGPGSPTICIDTKRGVFYYAVTD